MSKENFHVKVQRSYFYSEEELIERKLNKETLEDASIRLAKIDLMEEIEDGSISNPDDDFSVIIVKQDQKIK